MNKKHLPEWDEETWALLDKLRLPDAKTLLELMQKNANLYDLVESSLKASRQMHDEIMREVRENRKEVKSLQEVITDWLVASQGAAGAHLGEMKRVVNKVMSRFSNNQES